MDVLPYVDLRLTPDETEDYFPKVSDVPAYPYGLCISLCEKEIEKLGIDFETICTGDMVHIHAMAIVSAKSQNENQKGVNQRIELQITHMAAEDESDEDEAEEEELAKDGPSRLYKSSY